MAEMVVSASVGVMKPLLAKLTTLMGDEYKKLKNVRKEVVFLVDELNAMKAFLENTADADELDLQVKNWRNHVREMAYDIEDCIDDFMYQPGGADGNLGFLQKASSYIKTWKDRHRIANQIQEMKARVIQASDRRKRYKLDECITNSSSVDVDPRLPALYKESASLVGIDGPREELIEWVMDEGQQLKVVSVVGFGGLGKTTLANEVYHKIGEHFNCKAFVSVSLRPDMTRLLNVLILQLGLQPSPHACDVQDLINNIREYLQHKRYFIIVDDLWHVRAWDIIRCAFLENNQSSRVIITTRNEDVARSCSDNGYFYKMEPLSHLDSRTLFFNRIFKSEDACPSQFKEVSAEILKKCGGLPLAIITISGLLASQPTRLKEQWEYIRNSLGSQFATNPTLEGMRQILNLSYKNLPPHLKTCLLYLGMYPEDHEIWRDDLLIKWIAEGFVSALHGRDLVDVAKSYFNELLNRSLIQPKRTHSNGEVLSCGVHDMMLDLILSRCAEDNFVSVVYDPQSVQGLRDKVRRLSLNLNDAEDGTIAVTTTNLSQVRSLALFRKSPWIPPLLDFKFLRVLAIEFSDLFKMKGRLDLTGIARLFQLKCVKIRAAGGVLIGSKSSIQLPTQIGGLRHLEILDIFWSQIDGIPTDIVDLPRLMHLVVPRGPRLPDRIGNMESLQTLEGFDMSESSLDSIKGLGELKNLRQLVLCFNGMATRARMDALLSSIEKLRNLRWLVLLPLDGTHVISADGLSSWSAPPSRHLESLQLLALSFSRVPRWFGDLHNLWELRLTVREVLEDDVRLLGDLPSLTELWLCVPQVPVERIVISDMGFPALERFFFECDWMSYLTFTTGAMPILQFLWLGLFVDTWDHGTPVGIEHLLGLNEIYLSTKTSENTTSSKRKAAETAFRSAAQLHPTSPKFYPF